MENQAGGGEKRPRGEEGLMQFWDSSVGMNFGRGKGLGVGAPKSQEIEKPNG